jgi:hypothetical protein
VTKVVRDLKLTDRQLLRMVLAAQRDMANILAGIAYPRQNTADDARMLAHNLTEVLEGIPK